MASNAYCNVINSGQRDECLPCPGETIKPNTGDESSCTEDCGGGSKVANAEHIACGKLLCWFVGATFWCHNFRRV